MTTTVRTGCLPPGNVEHHFLTLVILVSTSAVYLYLNLFVLPGTPVLLSGDQVFFWMNGQRMLHGELPYRDFFQFTPPGADLVYWFVFMVLGPRIWVVNAVVLLLGVTLCWVCFEIATRLMHRGLAFLATLLFLTLIYSGLLNATHHWFSVLAIMTAVAILMRGTDHRKLAWAGVLLGIASFFTQTHGIVALLAISWFLKHQTVRGGPDFWRKEWGLLAGFVIALVSLYAYFIVQIGLERLFYCQVYYVLKVMVHKPETRLLGMPEPSLQTGSLASALYHYGQYFFVYSVLPMSYGLALYRSWRKPSTTRFPRAEVNLLAIVGCSLLAELMFSLNWLRVYAVSMAGIILFVWLLNGTTRARRSLLVAIGIVVAGLAVQHVWSTQRHDYAMAELPAGKCVSDPQEYEKLTWLMKHTKPGDFLFDAVWPGVYIPLELRNPVFLDTAGTTLNVEWFKQAVRQLDAKQVRYMTWVGRLNYPIDSRSPETAHIVPLRAYLHETYQLVHVFRDGEEVWERK
jgi:Dolichyl-phosphate-mannose-protein mannosyltransferase